MKIKKVVSALMPCIILGVLLSIFSITYSSGTSMNPTIKDGTVLIVNRFAKAGYGDIITVYSDELDKILLKRVIGKEGDTIKIKDGVVYRNGTKLSESFNKDKTTNLNYVVKANHVFVMGDNRNNSTDSRVLGDLPENNIKGVVLINTHIPKKVFIPTVLGFLVALGAWSIFADNLEKKRQRI